MQEPFELHDGSALRLTIARYYTPSGRCIQKTYKNGFDEYEHELLKRYEDGELEDSSKLRSGDTINFHTDKGRVVHAGGGITPDIFVPLDTTYSSSFITQILSNNLLNQFSYTYTDKHRLELKKYVDAKQFNKQFNDKIFDEFVSYTLTKNVVAGKGEIDRSREYIGTHLKALVARQLWRDQGYFTIISTTDKTIQKALSVLGNYEKMLSKK